MTPEREKEIRERAGLRIGFSWSAVDDLLTALDECRREHGEGHWAAMAVRERERRKAAERERGIVFTPAELVALASALDSLDTPVGGRAEALAEKVRRYIPDDPYPGRTRQDAEAHAALDELLALVRERDTPVVPDLEVYEAAKGKVLAAEMEAR